MDNVVIRDLEVFYHVGVTTQERAQPQRLLLTVEMQHDLSAAAATDDLRQTIDYAAVAQDLLAFGNNRTWNLIEKVGADIAQYVLIKYGPDSVTVEVRKFVIPQARYVSVCLTRIA